MLRIILVFVGWERGEGRRGLVKRGGLLLEIYENLWEIHEKLWKINEHRKKINEIRWERNENQKKNNEHLCEIH